MTASSLEIEGYSLHLMRATQAAAVACLPHVGRGDRKAADGAAVGAFRRELGRAPGVARVVIGEGEKDEAPMLYVGEEVGLGNGPTLDLAVDPLEGTNYCAKGTEGAIAVVACAPQGTLMATPGYYMEKLVVGPGAVGAIDIEQPIEKNLGSVAEALGKRVDELITIVLAKPRHGELIARIRATGAAVVEIPDGDVMGSLRALMPAGGIDLSVGVGGAPEGVVTACAVRLLGGDMQARLAPLSEAELTMIQEAGESPDRVLSLDDLVRSSDCAFVATGVTGGAILHQPRAVPGGWLTSSVLVTPGQPGAIVEAIAPTAG